MPINARNPNLPPVTGSGLTYQPAPWQKGWDTSMNLGDAARTILQGTGLAEDETMQGYRDLFLSRALGTRHAYEQRERSLAGATSPELAMLTQGQRQADFQGDLAGSLGQAGSDLHTSLAELYKGTATELAQLRAYESSLALQAHMASKARKIARSGQKYGLYGDLGAAFLSGAQDRASAGMGGGG